ncbi:MAG: hypothetical protein WC867_00950 [Candidatus Pacearchaeota archaeon]|jgi:hypothetical protein
MAKKLEKIAQGNEKARFIIALPNVNIDVREYSNLSKVGGSIATTSAGAVSQYLFREVKNPIVARTILANLRDRIAGNDNYAMKLADEFSNEDGTVRTGSDKQDSEEIEICYYLSGRYGGNPKSYLEHSRKLLEEFKRFGY